MKPNFLLSRFLLPLFFLLAVLFACSKNGSRPIDKAPLDNRNMFVGKYFPFYFGSKWYYTKNKVDKGQVLSTSGLVWRYDSLQEVIHIYNPTILISWMYCYREDDHHFVAGGGQSLLDDTYLDSAEGKAFITNQSTNFIHYTYGGLVQVPSKLGVLPCIKTSGVTGTALNNYYFRYFGLGFGMVREESYSINGAGDTTSHYITELDSCYIHR